jgi:hypothetical protein
MGNVNTGGKAFVMGNIVVNGKIIEGDSVNGGSGDSSLGDSIRASVQAQIAAARAAAAAQNGDATVIDGDFVAGGGVHHGNLNVNGDFVSRRKITIVRK